MILITTRVYHKGQTIRYPGRGLGFFFLNNGSKILLDLKELNVVNEVLKSLFFISQNFCSTCP